jgi:hypothetical protein
VAEILAYRAHVDAAMSRLLEDGAFPAPVVELGCITNSSIRSSCSPT